MNRSLLFGLTLFAAAALSAAAAVPVFNATLTVGKDTRFVLVGSDGKPSSWLQIGDKFEGYALKSYDAKNSALELESDGKTTRVILAADAAVTAGALAPTPATLADAEAVLNRLHFDEMMGRAFDRQKKMINAQFEQGLNRMTANGVSAEDAAAFRKKILDEVQTILDPAQLKTDMTKIYSEVFNKDELDAMSAFYTTPMGEEIVKKQGDVQDKIGGLVQSRMMQTMPKIQQMSQQFAMEQKAKQQAAAAAAPAAPAPAPAATPASAPAPKP